jgi:hypothetical protein
LIPPVPTVQPNYKLVVKLETEGDGGAETVKYSTFSTHSGVSSIARNQLISVPVTITKNNIISDDVVKKDFYDSPANSYIISEPGMYSIPAKKVSGTKITGGDTAVWLWASTSGGSGSFAINDLISNISASDTAIRFRVGNGFSSFVSGNVALALKDVYGKILWTWHIWITNQPPTDIRLANGIVILDRNIGALSADASASDIDRYGFLYQWGRKDPFIGGDGVLASETETLLSAKNHTIRNTGITWDAVSNSSGIAGTKDYASENPTRFIYSADNSALASDWLSTSDTTLWAGADKTDHDPCPYGYRVPDKSDFIVLFDYSGSKSQDNLFFRQENNRYWKFYWTGSSYGIQQSFFPAGGYRLGRNDSQGSSGGQLVASGISGSGTKSGSMPISGIPAHRFRGYPFTFLLFNHSYRLTKLQFFS